VAAGLSLAQVGGGDLTRQAVHLIETGKVRPSMRSLRILANRLRVPVAALVSPGNGQASVDHDSLGELDRLCRHQLYERALARGLEVLEWARTPDLVAGAHHFVGHALAYLSRPQEALLHLRTARELFEALDDDHGRVAETLELEAAALQVAEDPRAITVARDALVRYRALDGRRPEVESRLLQRVGTILVGRMEYRAALESYEEALEVAGGVRDLVQLARLYHGMATCHYGLGELRVGGDLLFKAHTLYEAEERLAGAGGRGDLARVENDIGMVLMRQGHLGRAEEYLVSSLDRFERAGLERTRSHALLSLGEMRHRQGRLDESVELVERAVDYAARFGETLSLAMGHRQLGELHAERGDRVAAEASFEQALSLLRGANLERASGAFREARDRALGTQGAATSA
jgi:tetratricopeptide (TPR) repeat protein